MSLEVQTTCPYCGVGCGIIAAIDEAGNVSVKGDPAHPSNYGRLCSKGAALADTIGLEGRLLYPEIEGTAHSWNNVLKYTADRFNQIISEYGKESVAFYVSGQLLTEDYYVANKLMKGYIGTANIDTNSRLCMSSAVAAHKRAFGSDTVPCCYEDLERAKLIVLVGSNTAWCHPVLYQRIVAAKKSNPDLMIVVIDPRQTATCDVADVHLAIKPGADHILFNGLLLYLHTHDEKNSLFVTHHTECLEEALDAARENASNIKTIADKCNLTTEQVEEFYRLFSRTERVVSVFSQGMNQWSYGTDKINSLINCHLITGRIGRPGMGPFSFTGQPNAMGGREVGGLANQLAAHMDLENESHREVVQSFWQSPCIADKEGLKAVDLFDTIHDGRIKALWVMATNPAVSLPDSNKVNAALEKLDFLVVSDCMRNTDTTRYANVLLPAQTWGEQDGSVTNSERRISRQRAFLPTPGLVRPDWWIISQVAKNMGYVEAFDFQTPAEVFREHATLSSLAFETRRDFNISAMAGITEDEYDQFIPIQWPITSATSSGTVRMFSDGTFFTPSGKAQFIAIENHSPAYDVSSDFPIILNTGRIRDHWHTMTRTGKSARLSGHIHEPYIEIHNEDATRYNINPDELVQVSSQWGDIIVRAKLATTTEKGSIFIPIHWNNQFASNAVVDKLVNPALDPVSGQPEFKHTPVKVEPYTVGWHGFVLSRRQLSMTNANYWVSSRGKGIWRYEIAGQEAPANWAECARNLLCQHAENVEWIEFHDVGKNRYRAARIENGHLESCIFIGPDIHLPERDWLQKLFMDEHLEESERTSILTGKSSSGQLDVGRIVCSCFGVGVNVLINTIRDQHLTTVESVGDVLRAGTNCGSCIPEIRELIRKTSS